jgi:prevent-host-death family protein
MKTMSAREAKNGFGLMIDTARAEPVLIEKHGRGVVVVVSVEENVWLSVQSGCADKGETGTEGRRKVANDAFARVKIDQLLKDAARTLTDGRCVRFEYPLDDGGKADYALFDRQGRALAVLEAKSTSVNLSAGEAQGRALCRSARRALHLPFEGRGSVVPRQAPGRSFPPRRDGVQSGRTRAPEGGERVSPRSAQRPHRHPDRRWRQVPKGDDACRRASPP